MSEDDIFLRKLKQLLSGRDWGNSYEIVDVDGIRKPVICAEIQDVEVENGGFNVEVWNMKINWRLLDNWLGGKNE